MTAQKLSLFATPIYIKDVENFDEIQKEFQTIYDDHIEKNRFADPFKDDRLETTDGQWNDIMEEYRPMAFLNELYDSVMDYSSDFKNAPKSIDITQSWMTRMKQHSYCHIHRHSGHGGAHLTGVYYFKAEESDAKLFFESPVIEGHCAPVGEFDPFAVVPKTGQLVIFPAWLPHGITTQTPDRDRISISFHIKFKF